MRKVDWSYFFTSEMSEKNMHISTFRVKNFTAELFFYMDEREYMRFSSIFVLHRVKKILVILIRGRHKTNQIFLLINNKVKFNHDNLKFCNMHFFMMKRAKYNWKTLCAKKYSILISRKKILQFSKKSQILGIHCGSNLLQ